MSYLLLKTFFGPLGIMLLASKLLILLLIKPLKTLKQWP